MGYCTNCGHPLEGESGFCSYCGAEHSADGEVALPGRPSSDLGPAGTLPLPLKPADTASMPAGIDQTTHAPPRFQTETVGVAPANVTATAGRKDGHSGGRWMLAVAVLVIIAAGASVAAMVLLRDGDAASGAAATSPSPSPTLTAPAVIRIMSLKDDTKVLGGQKLSVVVQATGVAGLEHLRLTVNGSPTGPTRRGMSTDSRTATFPWRPPGKGGTFNVAAEAVLQDGSVVRSDIVRVVVRSAVVPTPTVTVTAWAEPEPTYGSGGDTGGKLATPCWVAMISTSDPADAETWADRARAAGFTNVGTLRSSDYGNLNPGYYCAYLGPYSTEAEAIAAVESIGDAGLDDVNPKPYPHEVE